MLVQGRTSPLYSSRSTFELQVFRDGRWIISAVYDDRNLALAEARRLDKAGRVVCVREESGDGSVRRTVFLSTKIKDSWKLERRRIAAGADPHPPSFDTDCSPRHNETNPYRLLAVFSLLAFLGLAAVLALRTLYTAL
jgi:hypothetical protein